MSGAPGGNAIAAAKHVVDAANGRIYVKPTAADISAGNDIWVHYTPAGAEGSVIRTLDLDAGGSRRAALRRGPERRHGPQ